MSFTLVTNGSRAATTTIGASTQLYNANTYAGQFHFVVVDMSRLVAGEQINIQCNFNFPGSQFADRCIDQNFTYIPADGPHIFTPPIPAPDYFIASINQLNGTGRLVPWAIYRF